MSPTKPVLLVVCFLIAGHVMAQRDDTNRERAVALWEEAIKAKGGHEKLQAVETLVISSEYISRNDTMEIERLYDMPKRSWLYMFNPKWRPNVDVRVTNASQDVATLRLPKDDTLSPLTLRLGQEVQFLMQDPVIYMMESRWVHPVPVGWRTDGKGNNQLDVVETEVAGFRVDFYLDRKTRLPIKLVTSWASPLQPGMISASTTMTVTLGGYTNVSGIQMPRTVERVLREGANADGVVVRRESESARYSLNVPYNPEIFEGPYPKVRRADDWRLRKESTPEGRIQTLLDRLKGGNENFRSDARQKLVTLGAAAAAPLTALMKREKGDARVYAAAVLVAINPSDADALAVLRDGVQKGKGSAMIEAASIIASNDSDSDFTVEPLVREVQRTIILPTEINIGNQRKAAFALALTGPGVRALGKLLEHRDSWVRQAAVFAMDDRTETLRSASPSVRKAVEECIPELVNLLGDKDKIVRGMAGEVLMQIGQDTVPYLRKAIAGSDAKLASTAAEILAKFEQARTGTR